MLLLCMTMVMLFVWRCCSETSILVNTFFLTSYWWTGCTGRSLYKLVASIPQLQVFCRLLLSLCPFYFCMAWIFPRTRLELYFLAGGGVFFFFHFPLQLFLLTLCFYLHWNSSHWFSHCGSACSFEDAKRLIELVQGIPCKINLISFNPHTGSQFRPTSEAKMIEFRNVLAEAGCTVFLRLSRGDDQMAACGQLGNPGAIQAPLLRVPEQFQTAVNTCVWLLHEHVVTSCAHQTLLLIFSQKIWHGRV